MTSTETRIGMASSTRPSSRVLKPPGGGHSNIFAEPEMSVNAPRPKYNQQNSSNLNACMNSTDPNQVVEKLREEISHSKQTKSEGDTVKLAANEANSPTGGASTEMTNAQQASRVRVPPGGFSSGGFW